ncbi:MAG: hypothetical protein ACLR1G_02220 [Alistipes indistinctus]
MERKQPTPNSHANARSQTRREIRLEPAQTSHRLERHVREPLRRSSRPAEKRKSLPDQKGKNGISRRLASRILEHYPQINFTWLMTGKGHMLAEEKTDLFKIPITLRLTSEEAHDLLDLLKKMLEKPAPPDDRPL